MSWQWALVVLIELAAVGFLGWKLAGRKLRKPRVLQKPDVPASALLRRQKGDGGGTGSRRGGGSVAPGPGEG